MLAVNSSAGVALEVNLRNPLHAGEKVCKREIHPGVETQGKCYQKVQSRGICGPTKGLMPNKSFLEKLWRSFWRNENDTLNEHTFKGTSPLPPDPEPNY